MENRRSRRSRKGKILRQGEEGGGKIGREGGGVKEKY